jgi:hypothetical protein
MRNIEGLELISPVLVARNYDNAIEVWLLRLLSLWHASMKPGNVMMISTKYLHIPSAHNDNIE